MTNEPTDEDRAAARRFFSDAPDMAEPKPQPTTVGNHVPREGAAPGTPTQDDARQFVAHLFSN